MSSLNKAIEIAYIAHEGQVDKGGSPYISHPIRVMNSVESPEAKIVGVLHDAIEDSDLTFSDLQKQGFSEEIIEAIDALTKRSQEKYPDYLQRVKNNSIAVQVKLADLKDNCDLSRISEPTKKDFQRIEKYKQAILELKHTSNVN